MEQKGISQPSTAPTQNIGFQAPPAYEQHQNYPQQFPNQPQRFPNHPQQHQHAELHQAHQQFYSHSQMQPQVVTVVTGNLFGPSSTALVCPSCQKSISTRIDYESSTRTHLMAGLLCLLVWPCFCLPYLLDNCKNANHYCPHCSAYLGTYRGP